MASWAVVGGGMLGSALSLRLADHGEEVTLYESAPTLGGLASAWSLGDIIWDRHYHVTLASDRHTRQLLARLGLEGEMKWVQTRTGSLYNGQLHSMSNSWDYLRFPPLSLTDKTRLAWTILGAARTDDWRALEQVPVEEWLRAKSGDRVFEQFWLPLLEAKLGDAYRTTSAAFIWATIQRLYAARSSGMNKEMFGYVPGGYARILDRMNEVLAERGVTVRTATPVDRVSIGPVVSTGVDEHEFDHVVVAVAPPVASRIVDGLSAKEEDLITSIRYQGIVCASLLTERPLRGFYLTYLHDPAPFTGVVEMSAFVDLEEFEGRTLIYLPKYCAPDHPLFDEPEESLREEFLNGLAEVYPEFDRQEVLAFRVSRVRHVFPVPTVGYSDSVPAIDTSIPGVHLASSAQIVNGTLNVNETVELAERVSQHLLGLDRRVVA